MQVNEVGVFTADWSDEDWRKRLLGWGHEELLAFYVELSAREENYDFVVREAWAHALWCIKGEILERMSHSDNE